MNGLDLFAGSGIGSLALKQIIPDYKTVCYVEWEAYCQAILISRIKDGLLDDAPIWDDVRTFDGKQWRDKVDIVYGGFPCQPFSVAGKNKGAEDERNMWPDTIRIIDEVRPRYALLENVPNLLVHKYIRRVFGDLAEIGYDCEWDVVGAGDVGFPFYKNRLWMVASLSNCNRLCWRDGKYRTNTQEITIRERVEFERLVHAELQISVPAGKHRRMVNRIPHRMERLKMLGNAWVPQVVKRILRVNDAV